MRKPAVQPERKLFLHDDREVVVRYDYDKGEAQWFDAKAGVGSPGYPAEVVITEIDLGDGFVRFDTCGLPERTRDGLEDALLTKLIDDEAEVQAARAEAEYEAWKEAGALR